jgi:hypothetical protein
MVDKCCHQWTRVLMMCLEPSEPCYFRRCGACGVLHVKAATGQDYHAESGWEAVYTDDWSDVCD